MFKRLLFALLITAATARAAIRDYITIIQGTETALVYQVTVSNSTLVATGIRSGTNITLALAVSGISTNAVNSLTDSNIATRGFMSGSSISNSFPTFGGTISNAVQASQANNSTNAVTSSNALQFVGNTGSVWTNWVQTNAVLNILNFGAHPTNADNSAAISNAMVIANSGPVRTVLIPGTNFYVQHVGSANQHDIRIVGERGATLITSNYLAVATECCNYGATWSVVQSTNLTFENLNFMGYGQSKSTGVSNGLDGLSFSDNSAQTTNYGMRVLGCTFSNHPGHAIMGTSPGIGVEIAYCNFIGGSGGMAFTNAGGTFDGSAVHMDWSHVQFHHNLIQNALWNGIEIANTDSLNTNDNISITDNTFIDVNFPVNQTSSGSTTKLRRGTVIARNRIYTTSAGTWVTGNQAISAGTFQDGIVSGNIFELLANAQTYAIFANGCSNLVVSGNSINSVGAYGIGVTNTVGYAFSGNSGTAATSLYRLADSTGAFTGYGVGEVFSNITILGALPSQIITNGNTATLTQNGTAIFNGRTTLARETLFTATGWITNTGTIGNGSGGIATNSNFVMDSGYAGIPFTNFLPNINSVTVGWEGNFLMTNATAVITIRLNETSGLIYTDFGATNMLHFRHIGQACRLHKYAAGVWGVVGSSRNFTN